ncbi:hypothetical protein [Micromonospora auratinigra]|uniref:Flp pilus-assembly TadE/G-like n=1 Tax=Micromonospora auratinigra TaxID=261654 RepID=A0A1A8ZN12_9ACTN|nr:hypothetical protein [Micromonospora auratinigra]SBT45257.1 hypothetical protein GA0070611_2963 [Micromonospora auratinigra]
MADNPRVRYGGGTSARLRRGLLAGTAFVVVGVVGAALLLPLLRDRSQRRLEHRADREVSATAQRTRAALLAAPAGRAGSLRDAADAVDGVEVLTVRTDTAGVRLVFRVRVRKTASSVFGWQRASAAGCFAQLVRGSAAPAALERLPCPR